MNEHIELWASNYNPISNPYRLTLGFDFGNGSTLFSLLDFQQYFHNNTVHPDSIWTLVHDETGEHIIQGLTWKDAKGYFITKDIPTFYLGDEIYLYP